MRSPRVIPAEAGAVPLARQSHSLDPFASGIGSVGDAAMAQGMTISRHCCVVLVLDVEFDVELGQDVEPLRLVASARVRRC
jgi:hypothetical protein